MSKKTIRVIGIESSCDETSVAIVEKSKKGGSDKEYLEYLKTKDINIQDYVSMENVLFN